MPPANRPYHHGDLRRALLAEVAAVIEADGVGSVSVREVARRAGVSHTAVAHHFGDKAGLLTALAVEGHELLADALEDARPKGFLEVGVAYVRFAVEHPAHFSVMFEAHLLHADDEALRAAKARPAAILYGEVGAVRPLRSGKERDRRVAGLAAWSLVHGLASLVISGAVPPGLTTDPAALTRLVAVHLADPSLAQR